MTPTQRTLDLLRREYGMLCGITEHWNHFAHIRQDLFGFIDIIAVGPQGIIAVQCTTDSNRSARRIKILESPEAATWLRAGGKIWLVTWGKHGERWKRKLWQANIEAIGVADANGNKKLDQPKAEDYERFREWALESMPSLDVKFFNLNHANGFCSTNTQLAFGVWWAGYKAGRGK